MADWYYIGHYGQLGPLTREQIDELIEGGVVARDTYVWQTGMNDWLPAGSVHELSDIFSLAPQIALPPPPPMARPAIPGTNPSATAGWPAMATTYGGYPLPYPGVESDRSRVLAGILQLFLPGVGRMYLGYVAIGVLQLFFTFCTLGMGWLWSFVDGILILVGTTKLDGYGRVLRQ